MNYIIIEAQTQNGTTAIVTPAVYSDRVEAEAVFLEKCAAARRSGLPVHSVTWLDQEGKLIAYKCFKA
ncbi:MAG: hypothetical protein IKE25_07965 [Clostridia bacterium]|nr:hypothetical protein [Clostridia bacterium]